jgi:hypothetical protein
MRRVFLSMLLAGSLAGVVKAQQTTGDKAEAVKKEITKIELDKVAGLLRGGSDPADWIKHFNANDFVQIDDEALVAGSGETRDELAEEMRRGEYKVVTMKQDGHRVLVYNNGNTAVVTYRVIGRLERKGEVSDLRDQFTDVWVKQNGAWLRVFQVVLPELPPENYAPR